MRRSRALSIGLGTVAMCWLAASCAGSPASHQIHWAPAGDADDLRAYADQRHAELDRRATERPDDISIAAVTLGRPLSPAEAERLFDDAAVAPTHFEWRQVGTELRGGDGWSFVADRAAEFADLGVTYISGSARVGDWRDLARDERVWLVDLGGEGSLFDHAVEAGLLPHPSGADGR